MRREIAESYPVGCLKTESENWTRSELAGTEHLRSFPNDFLKPRHDIRQRRARAVFGRLRRRADVDEAGEFFIRFQAEPVEDRPRPALSDIVTRF